MLHRQSRCKDSQKHPAWSSTLHVGVLASWKAAYNPTKHNMAAKHHLLPRPKAPGYSTCNSCTQYLDLGFNRCRPAYQLGPNQLQPHTQRYAQIQKAYQNQQGNSQQLQPLQLDLRMPVARWSSSCAEPGQHKPPNTTAPNADTAGSQPLQHLA